MRTVSMMKKKMKIMCTTVSTNQKYQYRNQHIVGQDRHRSHSEDQRGWKQKDNNR